MTAMRVTFQLPREYVVDVDTGELRSVISQLPLQRARTAALGELGDVEAGVLITDDSTGPLTEMAYLISNTETGRDWLDGLAADAAGYLGTGTPEITDLRTLPPAAVPVTFAAAWLRERDAREHPHDDDCPRCGRRQWTDEAEQETCQGCGYKYTEE